MLNSQIITRCQRKGYSVQSPDKYLLEWGWSAHGKVGILGGGSCPVKERMVPNSFELPLAVWPPRIKPIVLDPVCAITHYLYRRTLHGNVKLRKIEIAGTSRIIEVRLEEKWKKADSEEIKEIKMNIEKGDANYPVYISSAVPEIINFTGSIITMCEADSYTVSKQPEKTFLEAELISAGLNVTSDRRQRRVIGAEPLSFDWPVLYEKSGVHEVKIAFRLIVDGVRGHRIISFYETPIHTVKVVSFGRFTDRDTRIGKFVASAVASGGVVVQAVSKIFGL